MAKLRYKPIQEVTDEDILVTVSPREGVTVCGKVLDYFVSGKKLTIKVEALLTEYHYVVRVDTPDLCSVWVIT